MTGFSTRHMRVDILDALRTLATRLDCNVEDAVNRALELGIPRLRKQARQRARLLRTYQEVS